MPYYVYILYSEKADKYYVGQTPDLKTRMLFHNQLSDSSYTSKYRPWELKLAIEVKNGSQAIKMERYIKGRKSRSYITKLIDSEGAVEKLKHRLGSAG